MNSAPPTTTTRATSGPRRWLCRDLDHPGQAVSNVTPNWFAAVMGTGIIAVAASTLPVDALWLRSVATVFWVLAAVLLVVLVIATALHWATHNQTARRHLRDPVMAYFYGAPAMAFLTVGSSTLLVGGDWLGRDIAVGVAWALWITGTVIGLASAVVVPYVMFTRKGDPSPPFGGWLMPVVPPMVSAATGAMLLPYAHDDELRRTLFWFCFGCFGLSLIASLAIFALLWGRLIREGIGPARLVPTWWIVLGPLGQSATAIIALAAVAPVVDPVSGAGIAGADIATPLMAIALVYASAVLGFALLWTVLAAALTIRTARDGLPFSLTWWSFTFPVGTCVTGFGALAQYTGVGAVVVLAVAFFVFLVTAWVVVAARTLHGALIRGDLLLAPVDTKPRAPREASHNDVFSAHNSTQ